MQDNLLAFPGQSQHILEYWLDESMQARWHKDALVPLAFESAQCTRDLALYREQGGRDFTTFATWLNGSYVRQYGPADALFTGYGKAFLTEPVD